MKSHRTWSISRPRPAGGTTPKPHPASAQPHAWEEPPPVRTRTARNRAANFPPRPSGKIRTATHRQAPPLRKPGRTRRNMLAYHPNPSRSDVTCPVSSAPGSDPPAGVWCDASMHVGTNRGGGSWHPGCKNGGSTRTSGGSTARSQDGKTTPPAQNSQPVGVETGKHVVSPFQRRRRSYTIPTDSQGRSQVVPR